MAIERAEHFASTGSPQQPRPCADAASPGQSASSAGEIRPPSFWERVEYQAACFEVSGADVLGLLVRPWANCGLLAPYLAAARRGCGPCKGRACSKLSRLRRSASAGPPGPHRRSLPAVGPCRCQLGFDGSRKPLRLRSNLPAARLSTVAHTMPAKCRPRPLLHSAYRYPWGCKLLRPLDLGSNNFDLLTMVLTRSSCWKKPVMVDSFLRNPQAQTEKGCQERAAFSLDADSSAPSAMSTTWRNAIRSANFSWAMLKVPAIRNHPSRWNS